MPIECAALVCAALGLACSVDENALRDRLYTCDVTTADQGACGSGYGCYGASRQIGSPDFCAPTCDVAAPPPEGTVCSEGSQLKKCNPSQTGQCGSGLSCIRTDLLEDEGVCLPLESCSEDKDCRDPVRSQCFAGEMARTYAVRRTQNMDLETDHSFCFQGGCSSRFEACAPGTTCLPAVLGPGAPDVCTPNCDSEKRCPPNFVCSSRVLSAAEANPFCIPGFLGFRCNSKLDCVVGDCVLVGTHKVCVENCNTSSDCTSLNSDFLLPATFRCVDRQCISPSLSLLELCKIGHADTDCDPGSDCRPIIGTFPTGLGLCVSPCGPGGSCPAKNGFPQSCTNLSGGGAPYCLIGSFQIPCTTNANCIEGLQCLAPLSVLPLKTCTVPCASHADCQNNPDVGVNSFCVGLVHPNGNMVCGGKGDALANCIDNIECKSGVCNLSGMSGTCAAGGS